MCHINDKVRVLSVFHGFVSAIMYHKGDAFDFDMVKFPFLDGTNVPRRPFSGVYISQLKRFARVCSHVYDCTVMLVITV